MLGDFNMFVGGFDGGSGMDEGDMNSFCVSVMLSGFFGILRSLIECFMMEEVYVECKWWGEVFWKVYGMWIWKVMVFDGEIYVWGMVGWVIMVWYRVF